MLKLLSALFIFSLFIVSDLTAQSTEIHPTENLKTITLTDGSKIKGTVVGVQNGIYTIQTTYFGNLDINDAQILSISAQDVPAPVSVGQPGVSSLLQNQVQTLQTQILSDPEIFADLEALAQDPEMLEILSDPEFVNAMTNYDLQRVQNHPQSQKLLSNPKMMSLIEKINKKQSNP